MSLQTPTLETQRLWLRPFTDADAEEIYALQSDDHVLRYWDGPPWSDRSAATRFLERCESMAAEGTGVRVAVENKTNQKFLGWCTFALWDGTYRSGTIGYCFKSENWGSGYATEASRELLGWAFEVLDLNRVESEVDTRNPASARVLEKLGFSLEGTLRENCIVNGDISDSWVYGLLRREWQLNKETLSHL